MITQTATGTTVYCFVIHAVSHLRTVLIQNGKLKRAVLKIVEFSANVTIQQIWLSPQTNHERTGMHSIRGDSLE